MSSKFTTTFQREKTNRITLECRYSKSWDSATDSFKGKAKSYWGQESEKRAERLGPYPGDAKVTAAHWVDFARLERRFAFSPPTSRHGASRSDKSNESEDGGNKKLHFSVDNFDLWVDWTVGVGLLAREWEMRSFRAYPLYILGMFLRQSISWIMVFCGETNDVEPKRCAP